MVPDLVGNHVGLGKVARGPKPPLELLVEDGVDVDRLVERAIEGPRPSVGDAAAALHTAGEDHEPRRNEPLPEGLWKDCRPDVLVVGEHRLEKLAHLVIDGLARSGLRRGTTHELGGDPHELDWVDPEKHHHDHDQEREQSATQHRLLPRAASIFDVRALSPAFPTHGCLISGGMPPFSGSKRILENRLDDCIRWAPWRADSPRSRLGLPDGRRRESARAASGALKKPGAQAMGIRVATAGVAASILGEWSALGFREEYQRHQPE